MIIGEKFRRYREIGRIVVKYGFGIFLERAHLLKFLKLPLRKRKIVDSVPVRLKLMLEELGPTFIKMGQILSTRPDLVPLPFIKELEKLQDEVKPIEGEEIKKVIQQTFGKDIEDLFLYFEEKPVASASISQVHKAKLKNGKEVAVKVRKPRIERVISTDIQILYDIARLIEKFIKEARIYQPLRIIEEFEKSIRKELDFRIEERNMERFRKNFADDENVYIPEVFKEFTTENILVCEYAEGIKINKIDKLEKIGIDRKKIAEKGVNATLKQIFMHGFFHADPHPGNIIILPDGKICYFDFGIVGKLDEERKIHLISLMNGFLRRDPEKIIRTLEIMGSIEDETDTQALKIEISEIIDEYYGLELKEIRIEKIMEDLFERMRKFRIIIPSEFSLLAKTLITIEGVGLALDPEFNLTERIKPFVTSFLEEKFKIINLINDFKRGLSNIYFLLKDTPQTFHTIMKYFKKGYINVAFEHKGLKNLTSTIDKSSNRISFALIISALLVSSSLIMVSGKGPLLMGLPAFGIGGFLISAILGIWLIVGIIRGGKI